MQKLGVVMLPGALREQLAGRCAGTSVLEVKFAFTLHHSGAQRRLSQAEQGSRCIQGSAWLRHTGRAVESAAERVGTVAGEGPELFVRDYEV